MKPINSSLTYDLNEQSMLINWLSKKIVKINHNFGNDIDVIVIADGLYLNVNKSFFEDHVILKFESTFIKDAFKKIEVIIYSIDPYNTNYRTMEVDLSTIHYDPINDYIYFDNPYYSSKVIPLIFNFENFTKIFSNFDITPSRIIVKNDNIYYFKYILEEQLHNVNEQITQILQQNYDIPEDVLYNTNSKYKELYDTKNNLELKLNKIGNAESFLNISKIKLYTYIEDDFFQTIRYGVNTKFQTWINNTVIVKHNLNGKINVLIDDVFKSNVKYKIYEISPNEIKIEFDNPKYVVCNARFLKVKAL